MDSAEKSRVQRKSKNGSKAYSWLKKMQTKYLFTLILGKKNNFKSEPLINAVGIWMVRKDIHILPIRRDSLHHIKLSVSN